MNRQEREQMVDRLLNEAFAPQQVEPRGGLEQRIIANLRAQPESRPRWGWVWVPAAVAAAVLLVVLLRVNVWRGSPTRVPASETRATRQEPARTVGPPSAPRPVIATRKKHNRVRRAPVMATTRRELLRQPVFAPGRLTQAESALVAMLQSKPAEAQALFQEQEQTRLAASEFMEQAMTPRR